jgi:hypothetical protein
MTPSNFLELQKLVLENVAENKALFEKELRKSFKWLGFDELQNLYLWAIGTFNEQYGRIIECVYVSYGISFENRNGTFNINEQF